MGSKNPQGRNKKGENGNSRTPVCSQFFGLLLCVTPSGVLSFATKVNQATLAGFEKGISDVLAALRVLGGSKFTVCLSSEIENPVQTAKLLTSAGHIVKAYPQNHVDLHLGDVVVSNINSQFRQIQPLSFQEAIHHLSDTSTLLPGSFVGRCWSDILRLAYNTSDKKACLLLPRRHTVIPPPIEFAADDIFHSSQHGHSGDVSLLEIPSPMGPTTFREIIPTTQEIADPSAQFTSPSPIPIDRAIPMTPSHRRYSLGQNRPSTLEDRLGSPCSSTDTNVSLLIETIAQKRAKRDGVHVQVHDELTTNTNSDQLPNEQQGLDYGKKSNFLYN